MYSMYSMYGMYGMYITYTIYSIYSMYMCTIVRYTWYLVLVSSTKYLAVPALGTQYLVPGTQYLVPSTKYTKYIK